jgi:hypothetical protein
MSISYNEEGRKEDFNDMTKHNFLAGLVCIFLFIPPCRGSAQTPPAGTGGPAPLPEVAVMTFAGDDGILNTMLRDAAIREIRTLGKFHPVPVPGENFSGTLDSPPDKPPPQAFLGASKYTLTGEYYTKLEEEAGHLQLWLWDSRNGSMVLYTDAWNVEDRIDALSYTAYMVSYIFSSIPEPEEDHILWLDTETAIVDHPPVPQYEVLKDPLNSWLYAGLRGGGSFRSYAPQESAGEYYSDALRDFSYEASFQAAFRFLPFMSIQAEAVYTRDSAKFQGYEYREADGRSWHIFYTDSYTSASLLFPLTLKIPITFDPYILSFFGGVYWALPLGKITLDSNIEDRETGKLNYDLTGNLGLAAGVDLGIRLGQGILFLDARYNGDFRETVIEIADGTTISYKRAMLSISIGYELVLINKKQHIGGN